jgi:hypothetical protein
MDGGAQYEVEVLEAVAGIDAGEWDACAAGVDPRPHRQQPPRLQRLDA